MRFFLRIAYIRNQSYLQPIHYNQIKRKQLLSIYLNLHMPCTVRYYFATFQHQIFNIHETIDSTELT